MLTIGIPTYNYNPISLIDKLLDCKDATTIPIEIIVVDDATPGVEIEKYKEKYSTLDNVKFFQNQENKGRTATRKVVARKASNDWILFLDVDVLPKHTTFITEYVKHLHSTSKIIFGGVTYKDSPPASNHMLRWKYGRARETKSAEERRSNPHFIISQNLLIDKDTFIQLNDKLENRYGLDNYFSGQIKSKNISIQHIDNPVIHLGLETSNQFLKKGILAAQTLVDLEKTDAIQRDLTPLQRAYSKLKTYGSLAIFMCIVNKNRNRIEKNLISKNPSLRLYDIYRLYHYSISKDQNANA